MRTFCMVAVKASPCTCGVKKKQPARPNFADPVPRMPLAVAVCLTHVTTPRMPHWNWPALIVALLVAAYWARVLKMVRKARRSAGHAANFVPPEPLGRMLRWVWIPVVGLWIVLPLAASFVRGPAWLRPLWSWPLIAWVAVAMAVAAFAATWVCWKKMGTAWRMGIDPADKTQLVCTGPYAFVRHPIYALSSLLMLLTMVIWPSPAMLAVGVVHLLLLQWEAQREERHLLDVHGQEYREYRRRTGRFVPRSLHPYRPQH